MTSIISGFLKGIKSIGQETVEKTVEHTGKIASGIITGQELIGNLKPMSNEQQTKAQQEEVKKQQEVEKIKQEYMGQPARNVEQEIEKVRDEKDRKEEEEERFLKNLERQRENERIERLQMQVEVPGNAKREAGKRQFAPGKKKKQAPDPASMSATNEMTGGKID